MACALTTLDVSQFVQAGQAVERFSEFPESKGEHWCLQAVFNPHLLLSQLAKFSEDTLSSYTEVVSSQVHPLYSSFSPSPVVSPLWIEPPPPASHFFPFYLAIIYIFTNRNTWGYHNFWTIIHFFCVLASAVNRCWLNLILFYLTKKT